MSPRNIVRPDAKSADDRQDRYIEPFARDPQKRAFFNGQIGEDRGSAKADIFCNGRFGSNDIARVINFF